MAFFPTDPRNEFAEKKLRSKRHKTSSNLVVLSICPAAFWAEDVRVCTSNGYLLMDKNLPSKHIESIYGLDYDHTTDQWSSQVIYNRLAAKLMWSGCRLGVPASSEKIASIVGKDHLERAQIVQQATMTY